MNTQLNLLGKRINMAPRAHRRWLVALIYAAFAVLVAVFSDYANFAAWCLIGVTVLHLALMQLVGRRNEATDEREVSRWDHAYARAYPSIGYCLVFALFSSGLTQRLSSALGSAGWRALLAQFPYMLLMAAGILYVTLPHAILLWTEPDMEPTD